MDRRVVPLAVAVVAVTLLVAVLAGGGSGGAPGGPFVLVDDGGRTVTEADFRGRFLLIFFGYTFCPDLCPTQLQVMTGAVARLGGSGRLVQPLFITVDPERDTVGHLHDYVGLFGQGLVGLTGSPAQVAAAARAYHVLYRRTPLAGGGYAMDHSGLIYLVAPSGRVLKAFAAGTTADAIAGEIRRVPG